MSKRYLLVKVISAKPLSLDQFRLALTDSVRRYFGEIGLSKIDPKVVRYDGAGSRAIVACRANAANKLQAAVALISQASGTPITPLVVGVSGTIKALGSRRPR
jgi:RNase P/RNase MRP subunit POP5